MSIAGNGQSDKGISLVEMAQDLQQWVERAAGEGRDLYGVERNVLDCVLQMGRAAIEQFLGLQGDGDLGETVSTDDGQTLYRSAQPVARPLRTIFGEHAYAAYVYRRRPHPHTPIVFRPVDARMSLGPGRWSFLLEEFTQLFCIEQAFEGAAEAFAHIFRQRLSVDTLERVNGRMGEQAAEFQSTLPVPAAEEEGELLVLTADGKGVPLVQADAARLRCFEEKPQRGGNRRMATVASVYSVEPHVRTPEEIVAALFEDARGQPSDSKPTRPTPQHKRVIARFPQVLEDIGESQPISGALVALTWAAQQVEQRRRSTQPLVRLMDGQPSLWDAADACLAESPEQETIDILDIIHVAGYVWRAAKVFHTHKEHQEAFARERLLRILQGEVHGVIRGLRRMATQRQLAGSRRQEIATVCGYFQRHAKRMRYDEYLARGCPLATGVIEGACRHLVKDRMERSGMRWTAGQAQAMLDVRAVHQSSYWHAFHQHRLAQAHDATKPYRTLLPAFTPLTG